MEEKRWDARSIILNAYKLNRKHIDKQCVIDEYLKGINLYLQILNKTDSEYNIIADAFRDIAVIYFNQFNYPKAGQYYLDAIKQLLKTDLNDITYRKLVGLYIDLADASYEMLNQQAGDEAMTNALKAFNLIKIKNKQEIEIGNPVTNFIQFHTYYEKKLSTATYINSSKYLNHEHLLGEGQFAREEQALFQQFEHISISELNELDKNIEKMLSQLSLSAEQQLFNQVLINQSPSDGAYRNMAMQFLRLAQSHMQKQSIKETIETYDQVIKTLQLIKTPQENDLKIIKDLGEQIKFLQNKSRNVKSQMTSPPGSLFNQPISFFASPAENETTMEIEGITPKRYNQNNPFG